MTLGPDVVNRSRVATGAIIAPCSHDFGTLTETKIGQILKIRIFAPSHKLLLKIFSWSSIQSLPAIRDGK
jgi:hypothetical protein